MRRPSDQSRAYIVIEEFAHAGLKVGLSVVGQDFSPRYADSEPDGVIVCAQPHRGLSDMDGEGRQVLADDAALAALLAAPLAASGLPVLEAHARSVYRATVVLPLFVDEADASARTGISLSAESGDGWAVPLGTSPGEPRSGAMDALIRRRPLHNVGSGAGPQRGAPHAMLP